MNESPRRLPYHIKSQINSVHKQFSSWYSTPSSPSDDCGLSPKDPQLLTSEIFISTEEAIVYSVGL